MFGKTCRLLYNLCMYSKISKLYKYIIISFILIGMCIFSGMISTTRCDFSSTPYPSDEYFADLSDIKYFAVTDSKLIYSSGNTEYHEFDYATHTDNVYDIGIAIDDLHAIGEYACVRSGKQISFYQAGIKSSVSNFTADKIDVYRDGNVYYLGLLFDSKSVNIYTFEPNLQNIITYIYNAPDNQFQNPTYFTISKDSAYIVGGADSTNLNKTYEITFGQNSSSQFRTLSYRVPNTADISYFYYNNEKYMIVLDNDLNIANLSIGAGEGSENEGKVISTVKSSTISDDIAFTHGKLNKPTDIKIANGYIYVSDSANKSIQRFPVHMDEVLKFDIENAKVILAGTGGDIGRLNGVSNVFSIDGQSVYVCDTANNRVQIFNGTNITKLSNFYPNPETDYKYPKPKSVFVDDNQRIYIVGDDSAYSRLWIYSPRGVELANVCTKTDSSTIGRISHATISKNDTVYAIDYTNNCILRYKYATSNSYFEAINTTIPLNQNSRIDYLIEEDKLVILTNNTLYVIDTNCNTICNTSVYSALDIATDYSQNIFILNNGKITRYIFNGTTLTPVEVLDDSSLSQVTAFDFVIKERKFVTYNSILGRLYSTQISDIPAISFTTHETISHQTLLSNMVGVAKMPTSSFIYELPYTLGKHYNIESDNNTVFVVGIYNEYSRIIFLHDNIILDGYTRSSNLNNIDIQSNTLDLITINKQSYLFSVPVMDKYNNNLQIYDILPQNTVITSVAKLPSNINGKTFYVVKLDDNNYGYIFIGDVIKNNRKSIKNLLVHNANVHTLSKNDVIKVYSTADVNSEVLFTLKDKDKIKIDSFDRNSQFTKVTFMDSDNNIITGYVLTKYVSTWGINMPVVIASILLAISIIILIVIMIIFRKTKKRI